MADRLFPSILPGEEERFADDTYRRRELEQMEWAEIRAIAAEHPTDAVDGQSEQGEMVEALTGAERL